MKKKAVLLTITTKNYGGVLQAFALQRVLMNLGFECEILRVDEKRGKKRFPRAALSFFYQKVFLPLFKDRKRERLTKSFQKKMKMSKLYKENHVLDFFKDKSVDFLIVGSDQVWNDRMFGTDLFFWPYCKRFFLASYAASFGYSLDTFKPKAQHLEMLKRFDRISVRETEAKTFLEKTAGFEVAKVLDPTLLLPREEWTRVCDASSIDFSRRKFGFVYIMPGDKVAERFIERQAQSLANKTGVELFVVGYKDIDRLKRKAHALFGVGPSEWLHLLYHSTWVMTNSFHGTVFSLLFEKRFCAVINSESSINNPARITDLLECAKAKSHLVDVSNPPEAFSIHDPADFKTGFEDSIAESYGWLYNCLGIANGTK